MDGKRETVYLVDGSGYIFRAFYAVETLSTSKGFPTNALYGFSRMLLKLLSSASDATHTMVVFDAGKHTFRTDLYPQYKANRKELPEDLRLQMPHFERIVRALGIPVVSVKGYEADDIIGTVVTRLEEWEGDIVVVTADKDLMQLVSPKVTLWDTMRDTRVSTEQVIEKFGVPPERVADALGLIGDSSDNIPGVPGIGPKTAAQLLQTYHDISGVLAHISDIEENLQIKNRKKIATTLREGSAILELSKKLATIDRNCPTSFSLGDQTIDVLQVAPHSLVESLHRQPLDTEALEALTTEFEFSKLFSDVVDQQQKLSSQPTIDAQYTTVLRNHFQSWSKRLGEQQEISIDLETTSLDPLVAKIVGIAVCWDSKESFYIPVAHRSPEGLFQRNAPELEDQISLEEALKVIGPLLRRADIRKVGQNLKYDISVFHAQGYPVEGVYFDTMIAAYLLTPDRRSYSLGSLALDYLGQKASEYQDVVAAAGGDSFEFVSIAEATQYAAEDAHFAWLLKEHFAPELEKQGLSQVFHDIEMPLISVLSEMELRGVRIDEKLLYSLSQELSSKIEDLQTKIFDLAGTRFNLNSPKQLSEILFERLGIPSKGLKKTKTSISTDSSVLEKIRGHHPVVEFLLTYRMLHKLKSTYVDALPAQISPVDGRLHTKFNQTVAGTGRLSSSDPNLQNIPVQTSEGRRIRRAFIAREGSILLSADYSQIELRILAHMSGDENLIEAFRRGEDIHEKTARELFHRDTEESIAPEERRAGKTMNFGIIYGMSAFRLAGTLGVSVSVGSKYIETYFAGYPKVRELFDQLERDVEQKGYVTTLFGRKRVIANLDTSGRDAGFTNRAAINAPIQGTAADVIKLAMIRIANRIQAEALPLSMILQIHDELLFECDHEFVDAAKDIIRTSMEGVAQWSVPLEVDIGVGPNWQEAH